MPSGKPDPARKLKKVNSLTVSHATGYSTATNGCTDVMNMWTTTWKGPEMDNFKVTYGFIRVKMYQC